jgi:oligopeptidase B
VGDRARWHQVPVSVVYKKGFKKDGSAALLQYAYGSYGSSMDPYFSQTVVSLLDRGMVYALAHIRGGQEMGRQWYDDGKLLKKKNTFTDFIDVTDFLVKEGYAGQQPRRAHGGSAGGLLMGAIANMAPDRYRAILSQVPFVDVVTTMLDASIPLTTNEYDEWGNPEKEQGVLRLHAVVLALRQPESAGLSGDVRRHGLWDSQVQYYEPAKYVARLRDVNTSQLPVLFRTNMDAGHGGKSGGSAAIASCRRCMRSCSTSSASWTRRTWPASDALVPSPQAGRDGPPRIAACSGKQGA